MFIHPHLFQDQLIRYLGNEYAVLRTKPRFKRGIVLRTKLCFEQNRASNKDHMTNLVYFEARFCSKRCFVRSTVVRSKVKSYHCSSNQTVLRTNRTAVLRTPYFEHVLRTLYFEHRPSNTVLRKLYFESCTSNTIL